MHPFSDLVESELQIDRSSSYSASDEVGNTSRSSVGIDEKRLIY